MPARKKPTAKKKPAVKRKPAAKQNDALLLRGARKTAQQGLRDRRVQTHKKRATWFRAREAWPLREAPVLHLTVQREKAARRLPAVSGATWELVGPTNIGGRCTSIVCDPANPDRLWIGAAGGGVWHSTDGGLQWRAQWHKQPVLNIGSLAIDPRNSNVIYAGTGEANLSADSHPGVGLYRSANGGRSWRQLAMVKKCGIPRRIGAIAIDPFDSQHIRIGGVNHDWEPQPGSTGMYYSRDGGRTWVRENFVSEANDRCHAILFHPTRQGTIFATFSARGVRNGFWRTRDGGATWVQLTAGLPNPSLIGRSSLALCLSNPDTLYLLAADDGDLVRGVFRSNNGGDTWRSIGGTHFAGEGQMSYGNTIVVHPTNADHVICGGVDLHRTTNGGQTWRKITRWDADRGDANYAHADHHALLMPAARPGLVLNANDGGLDVSADGGTTWTNRSAGLAATMFYDCDVAQSDGRIYGGGAQDNGTVVTQNGSPDTFSEILGGDGGWLIFDPGNAGHAFGSWQFVGLHRWRAGTQKEIRVPVKESELVWMAFSIFDPSNSRRVFLGTTRVWRTDDDGDSWRAMSPVLDGSPISALEVSTADTRRIYAGTENGGIFRSLDRGVTWSGDVAGPILPGRLISRLDSHPTEVQTVLAAVAGSGHSHVFLSADGGSTWQDIDHGLLPDVPCHAALFSPFQKDTIYAGSDAGVFVSRDRGANWENLSGNLPNTMVVDLVIHEADRTLTAATYGRSIWRIKI